jgi:hypothetical protein
MMRTVREGYFDLEIQMLLCFAIMVLLSSCSDITSCYSSHWMLLDLSMNATVLCCFFALTSSLFGFCFSSLCCL